MQYFNIQLASQLSGVASATIRAWEKRYNAVIPHRADNQHRLYSEQDIEKLALLYQLTEIGQGIGKIAHLELAELKAVYTTLLNRPYDKTVVAPQFQSLDYSKVLSNLHLSLEAYKLDIISHEIEKAQRTLSPKDFALKIIVPLFQLIGDKVSKEELSIAQEHALSAITSFYAGQMIGQHYQKNLQRDDLVLITTPEGEMHAIGILAAALLCVHHGIRFIYLGPNLPAHSLIEMAQSLKAKTIILGATKGHELQENQTLQDYLKELQNHLSVDTKILVGGNLKSQVRAELEKNRIPFFPNLDSLNTYLEKY